MTKDCQVCGTTYARNRKYSKQQWAESKFCGRSCLYKGQDRVIPSGWNKGKSNPWCSGDKHYLWRGGVTNEHEKIRHSTAYRDWRTSVFKRDDYTCQICRERGVELQADHIKPFALFPDLRFELSNGRTLCKPCHRATPTFGNASKSNPSSQPYKLVSLV